jgi:outer membrane lipopolysaccharide assembly protein LptE/RlpB
MFAKNVLFLSFMLCLCHCASRSQKDLPQDYSRVFNASYESIWRATQQALLNYPMNINNMDTGNLQTLFITGKHRYIAPHESKKILPSGFQYRLNINIIKGEKRCKVIISKETRLQKDFFSDPQELMSDGYEEKALIYRIRRELIIENLLKKQMENATPETIENQDSEA